MSAWVRALVTGVLIQGSADGGGSAPPHLYEYFLVGVAVVVLVWVFYLAVRMTLRPGEEEKDHIKRLVLEDEERHSHE